MNNVDIIKKSNKSIGYNLSTDTKISSPSKPNRLYALLCITGLLALIFAAGSQRAEAKDARVEKNIAGNPQRYDALDQRLRLIEQAGDVQQQIYYCEARAWLDVAFDSRAQRDSNADDIDALGRAEKIIGAIENKNISPLLTLALQSKHQLVANLWSKAVSWRKQPDSTSCAACDISRLQVQLVQADYAYRELGKPHAKPYVQHAERIAGDTQQKIDQCVAPVPASTPAPTAVPQPVIVPVAPPVTPVPSTPVAVAPTPTPVVVEAQTATPSQQVLLLADRVHFAYRKSTIAPASRKVLDRIASLMRANPELAFILKGYADKRGSAARNLTLSQARAKAVRNYLIKKNISANRLSVSGLGKASPVDSGSTPEALAKNRRVEFVPITGGTLNLEMQNEDLQIESKTRRRKKRM
jgi:outer membrane protein OmpA-like peptidoglycan-associated protein